jgi:GWxTD domain-containing protein
MILIHNKKKISVHLPLFGMVLGFVCLFLFSSACHYYNLEKKLNPDDKEWLSQVRYIITSQERKLFLDLPQEDKEQFKEEFWARRDPDPGTEENEFKMEYYNRVERTTELFVSEAKPGWLTDRGRIYILFGPPMDRMTYPQSFQGYCQEIWYYGAFPVVFVDRTCTGKYDLVTYDLTSLRAMNLMYMHELSSAQARAQQTIEGRAGFFNFDWKFKVLLLQEDRLEGEVFIEVPFTDIWFKEDEGRLVTVLDLRLELKDVNDALVWEYEESFEVLTNEEEIQKSKRKKYEIEVPVVIDRDMDKLRIGKNRFFATLINRTGNSKLTKALVVDITDK